MWWSATDWIERFGQTIEINTFATLKQVISIFIALTLLVFSTGLQELAKLPVLFQHYFEHQSLNQEITFAKYLWEHYNSVPHTDADAARDNQLPFKSMDQSGTGLLSLDITPFYSFPIKLIAKVLLSTPSRYQGEHIPDASGGKIWQPPKSLIYS
jgi:hypothetical protein